MSAHREITSEALSEVSLWACSTTLRTWEGWSRSRFLSPVLLEEGTQLKGRPCVLRWNLTGVFSCVVWTWLFYLPPFLTSGRWGSNHCSISRSCHAKVPVGLTVVWKVSRWEVEVWVQEETGRGWVYVGKCVWSCVNLYPSVPSETAPGLWSHSILILTPGLYIFPVHSFLTFSVRKGGNEPWWQTAQRCESTREARTCPDTISVCWFTMSDEGWWLIPELLFSDLLPGKVDSWGAGSWPSKTIFCLGKREVQ